jgi:membrane protein
MYFIAPNVRQRFRDQVVVALAAVMVWILVLWALGWYISNFADYNKTFGTYGRYDTIPEAYNDRVA